MYTDCGAPHPAFGFPRGMRDFASLDATCDTPEAVEVHVYSWASSSFVEVVRPLPTHCPAQRPVTQALSGSSNAGPKDSVSLYDSTARSGWHTYENKVSVLVLSYLVILSDVFVTATARVMCLKCPGLPGGP